ncbi:MAG: substrate-binding domain-containing protein [Bacteroidetes bacterium]|nr:substrate-binding domain-containing protein [Bacteroidota bacterium]
MNLKTSNQLIVILMLACISCWLVSCNHKDKPTNSQDNLNGKITISGAFALYPLTIRWAEEFRKIHPNVTINISAGGAGKGMADALSKMVDLGMYSKEVSPEEKAKGAWSLACAKDAVLPVMNASNPLVKTIQAAGVTKDKFYGIFITGNVKTWGQLIGNKDASTMDVFTRSDACGAADMWAKFMMNKKQEDLQGIGVNGDPGVADAVRKTVYGIGYNNLNFVFDVQSRKPYQGLAIVPIDINGNGKIDKEEDFYHSMDEVMAAINDGRYPSPPARQLYFVSAGKPSNKLVLTFLNFILSDGQKYVNEAGYVRLKDDVIRSQLNKLQ